MKLSSYKSNTRRIGVFLIFLLPGYLMLKVGFTPQVQFPIKQKAVFVGKESCKDCHLGEYNDWAGSHHDMAMDVANDSTVLGNFFDQTLKSQGKTQRMYKKDGRFFVFTDGEDGQMQEFEVKYVFGYTPLQQYLVEFNGGRLQTLPLTWNTVDSTWYHMADSIYQDENVDHNNWLHWTNQAQNWNSMCAECHSTNLKKGYDPQKNTYNTTWSEIDVSCEACHGPGSEHIEWANLPEYSREEYTNYVLVTKTSGIDNTQYVDNCMRCHSRKSSLGDFDHYSSSIYDHYIPQLPDEPNWFIDGQILNEDYAYASFLQSKMYQREREVQCNDCHNVHSGELLYEGNDLCLQCHQKEVYDAYDHHHHKQAGEPGEAVISESGKKFEVGSGTECINCHMHGRYYMGIDYRRDHSFRIPRPDLSIKHGTPNACNQCHADETNEWADQYITQWFGESRRFHYSEPLATVKEENPEAVPELKDIINNDLYPPNIRALALQHIGNYFPDFLGKVTENFLAHPDPLLRISAIRTIHEQSEENINKLITGLTDATRAVRTEAVQRLMQAGKEHIPQKHRDNYQKALKEYKEVLLYNADFPTGKVNLANYYYNRDKPDSAEMFYKAVLEQHSELTSVHLNLAYLYNRQSENEKAENQFRQYLQKRPEDIEALYSYAILLSEMRKYEASLDTLLKVSQLAPERPRVNHNIGMMYDFMGEKEKAGEYLKREIEINKNLNSLSVLLRFYLDNNYGEKALELGRKILEKYPNETGIQQVVEQLETRLGGN